MGGVRVGRLSHWRFAGSSSGVYGVLGGVVEGLRDWESRDELRIRK